MAAVCSNELPLSRNHPSDRLLHDRLQNSEQERKQSDQSDKDMKVELEGKVDALQRQLADLDTLRSAGNERADAKLR